jgi:chromosome segregation ATPase
MSVNEMVDRLRAWSHDERLGDGMLARNSADMLVKLRARAEAAERRLDVYNSGGFKDADALAERFISLTAERDELREENERLRAQVEGLTNKCALLAASWKKAEDRVAELDGTVKAMVEWLEADEPSVFRRGLWDAIRAAQPKTSR